jgi:hypothetical protein
MLTDRLAGIASFYSRTSSCVYERLKLFCILLSRSYRYEDSVRGFHRVTRATAVSH